MNIHKKVSLIGAGPGDPELITLKGLKAIKSADAILYDALVNEELLSYARRDAVLIPVGKRCGEHSMTQDEINLTIIQSVYQYGHVVRLKGGDPFIFGRGYEELEYIRSFDIPVEIIPGISSSTSLPLLQSVPLTSRGVAESFWVITGTTKQHRLSTDIALAAQSTATVVILMGLRKIRAIADLFLAQNKASLPVMIILNGSRSDEQVVISTIDEIADKMNQIQHHGPGLIVIGAAVALHPEYVKDYTLQNWK
jgi:uroporphyrin-III C-methyltransferase